MFSIEALFSERRNSPFRFRPGSPADRTYGGVYQGFGIAYYDFANPQELGNPVAAYLFQGARIARLSCRLSLDYEWNFGLSFGWKPYDRDDNRLNTMMGSKINAFLNVNFFLRWMLTRELDLTFGPTLTHFSNGNTKIPNAGLNSAGIGAGLTYNFGRERAEIPQRTPAPEFRRHFSYDLVLFGSWCSKGVEVGDGFLEAVRPGSQAHDEMVSGADGRITRLTNRAGGIEGGMSNGQPIRVRAAMKPIPSIPRALRTVDVTDGEAASAINQRSDSTAVPAASVVAEAMVRLTLARYALDKFGGDSVAETRRNFEQYVASWPEHMR